MSIKWIGSAMLCTGLAFACGGGEGGGPGGGSSGIPANTLIVDLTPDQAADFCEYFIGLQESPERTIDCNGEPVTVGIDPSEIDAAVAECTAEIQSEVMPGCNATVGDAEDCFETLNSLSDDELCNGGPEVLPASCNELFNNSACG